MFKRFNEPVETIDYKAKYLELDKKYRDIEEENTKLKIELGMIKPVFEKVELEPAVSIYCRDCEYCVRSSWSGDIIGCCKKVVCEDYKKEKNDA